RPLATLSGSAPPRHTMAAPSKPHPVRSTGDSSSPVSRNGQIQSSPRVSMIGSVLMVGCMDRSQKKPSIPGRLDELRSFLVHVREHDPEKRKPVFGKIVLKQKSRS